MNPIFEILHRHCGAVWDGNELLIRASSGMESIAKIESRTLKRDGEFRSVKRLMYRRDFYVVSDDHSTQQAWYSVRDVDPGNGVMAQLTRDAELLALYSRALPYISGNKGAWVSFEEYESDKGKFLSDVTSLLETDGSLLRLLAEKRGMSVEPRDIHGQMIEAALGFRSEGPRMSLREIIQQAQTMQEGAKMSDSKNETLRARVARQSKKAALTGAVNAVTQRMISQFLEMLGDKCPPVLKTPAGVALLQVVFSFTARQSMDLPLIADRVPEAITPKLAYALDLQFEHALAALTSEGVGATLDVGLPMIQEYINAIRSIEAPEQIEGLAEPEEAQEIPVSPVRQREVVPVTSGRGL